MAAPRLVFALVFVGLLLVPVGVAAPASGALDVSGAASLRGPVNATAAGVDALWNSTDAPDLALDGSGIHIERIGTTRTVEPTALGDVVVSGAALDQTTDIAAGRVTFLLGNDSQLVALRATGPATLQAPDETIRPVSAALLASVLGTADAAGCGEVGRCLASQGSYELSAPPQAAKLGGTVSLLVRGPTLRVVDASGSTTSYASGRSQTASGPFVQTDDAWLVVTLQRATGSFASAPVRTYLSAPTLAALEASMAAATGSVEVGGKEYRAADEALDAAGQVRLELAAVAPGKVVVTSRDPTAPAYADAFHATIAGDVERINLRAAPVYEQPAAQAAGIAAIVAGGVAALAYYWPILSFHIAALAAPLYTRLRQPEILDNDVRSRIYDIIRANPGISARAVHRESTQSWGTVVYHLRQLERHNLVVSRTLGRTRNYYENHGKYKGMEAQLACLQAPRALALAHVILERPGMTQEQLVERSGFPQPTASYYLRKLRNAGLLDEVREGRYVRYVPAQDLARFVEVAEAAPVEGNAAAGVNA